MRPDRFRAVAGLSVPYRPRGKISAIEAFKAGGMDTIYMMYFQEPGVAEREFERDVKRTLAAVYYSGSGSLPADKRWRPFVPPGKGLLDTGFENVRDLPQASPVHAMYTMSERMVRGVSPYEETAVSPRLRPEMLWAKLREALAPSRQEFLATVARKPSGPAR